MNQRIVKANVIIAMFVVVSMLTISSVGLIGDPNGSSEILVRERYTAPETTYINSGIQEVTSEYPNHSPSQVNSGYPDIPTSQFKSEVPDGNTNQIDPETPDRTTNQGNTDFGGISDLPGGQDASKEFSNEFTEVPAVEDTDSEFSYSPSSPLTEDGEGDTIFFEDLENHLVPTARGNPNDDGDKGNKLGNAPEALYRVLEKFLAKGKLPPPNFPVPYVIYTNASGVEKFTDVLTKMPIQINVDNNKSTGQGNGKDIKVKTTMSTNPLEITTVVELKNGMPVPDLEIYVSFPAFFYNGEAGAPDGEPYWLFGYETRPGSDVPGDITMVYSVNQSLGSSHTFDFDWSSESGIDPLRFRFGTFQVVDKDTTTPIYPAFAAFEVSSPSFAGLTFETKETSTTTQKCMIWSAPTSFGLSFNFSELENITGLDYIFPMSMIVDQVPQSFSICTTEDRAANTYSVDYVASSTVDLVLMSTEIEIEGTPVVEIDLRIEDMPAELHVLLGDGYLDVDVDTNVGLLSIDATADLGFAEIDSMINARLRVYDIPDFNATWYADGAGNGFALNAVTCVGTIELAFSYGDLEFPIEHIGDPDSHYLFAFSDPSKTAIAVRIIGVNEIDFDQSNADQSNSLSLVFCDNNVFYVIAHTEVGSMLTPGKDVDLRVVMDETPTELTIVWTVPFTLGITTNDAIDSIVADLTVVAAGPPAEDLTAHAVIYDIPSNMTWDIDPDGSIAFTADDPIGTVILEVTDPNGLPGAKTFFEGDPIRLLKITSHDIPSFTASWDIEPTPWTSLEFNTAPLTSLGDLTFGISTSVTTYATLSGTEDNRIMVYNDDYLNLGNGKIMESSIWLHVEDVSRVEVSFGGTDPAYEIGISSAVAHDLKASARLDRVSSLNPAPIGDDVNILIVTSNLPTSMDLTIIPSGSFEYDALGTDISHVDIDALVGDLSPAAPDPADVDALQLDVYDIPGSADGQWELGTDSGSFNIQLEDDSELGRVEIVADNAFGIFGSAFEHFEAFIDTLPEDVDAEWDMSDRAGMISFSDASFEGGLGEAFVLATTMNEASTTSYINSLDIDTSVSMTTYSSYEAAIDSRYWPGTTLENNLKATYTRNPELNTDDDDFVVYRSGASESVFTARFRELHSVDVSLANAVGYAEIQFTPDITTDRQMYIRTEDVDPADDDLTLVELSELPNTAGENLFRVDYDRTKDEYSFESSEVIDFIDIYMGTRESTSQTKTWYKVLLADLPELAELSFDLDDTTKGFLEFKISSNFEIGVVVQDSNGRYAGWIELTGIRFDYEFYGPGQLATKHTVGYYITRIDVDIHTLPASGNNEINGILGIYTLKSNPANLIGPALTAPSSAYIPEWTFMLCDFTKFRILVDWDVGITFTIFSKSSGVLDIELFPTISIETGFRPVIDYWWNSQKTLSIPHIPLLPPLPPFLYMWMDGSIILNKQLDYVENKPIHLLPIKTLAAVQIGLSANWKVVKVVTLNVKVTMTIDVPGFHGFGDHCDPTP